MQKTPPSAIWRSIRMCPDTGRIYEEVLDAKKNIIEMEDASPRDGGADECAYRAGA